MPRTPNSDARNEVIQKLTEAIQAFNSYVEQWPGGEERLRLIGQGPKLCDARYQFERATRPDELFPEEPS